MNSGSSLATWEVPDPVIAGSRNHECTRALVDRNPKIPLGQFQRRRQPSDPTAEYRYPRTSRYCPSRCWDTHQSGCGGQTGQRPVPEKLPARPTCMHPVLPHAS
jgi:hypothetical protein